ncbi:hypothetical protein H8356DRAFT_1639741 [Neocallimastix lanati (nom. inval.)]|jgi:hypothetical protein|uniref:Alpha/beta-hydrolase n=1 Tax=Neocallimastix californiae TaxID=1754190 RepID=A0A1Y2ECN6_9FUNG|nr:hypothetical protein H8356DRAFT_1639741 [Neocallimastix sp. JGI-2020a]ORY69349.1 hypothetical protein LY90DRAFT_667459 [Neocallimastix californiae]|eukprot:ORY69349.1 hypothetical protein LY90DRAFT_667459 [Neocallimastix californiae]
MVEENQNSVTKNEKVLDYTDSKEEIIDINGVSTKILYIKAENISENSPRTVVILVPGSPGIVDYYRRFMGQIYDTWDKKIDIYGIEHSGHTGRKLEGDNVLYSNQQLIDSKIKFFDMIKEKPEYANPDTKFYFIAHSLGGYMVLKLLEARPISGIVKAFLIFPAIHEIEKTPSGNLSFKLIKYEFERKLVCALTKSLDFLPVSFKASIVKTVAGQSEDESEVTAKELLNSQALSNIIYLTQYEREEIKSIDEHLDFIREHMNELFFYYSTNDGWATKEHYELLKKRLPEHEKYNNIQLDEDGIPHAFVIGKDYSRMIAEHLVYDWLKIKERPEVKSA